MRGGFFPEEKNLLGELWLTGDGGGEKLGSHAIYGSRLSLKTNVADL